MTSSSSYPMMSLTLLFIKFCSLRAICSEGFVTFTFLKPLKDQSSFGRSSNLWQLWMITLSSLGIAPLSNFHLPSAKYSISNTSSCGKLPPTQFRSKKSWDSIPFPKSLKNLSLVWFPKPFIPSSLMHLIPVNVNSITFGGNVTAQFVTALKRKAMHRAPLHAPFFFLFLSLSNSLLSLSLSFLSHFSSILESDHTTL